MVHPQVREAARRSVLSEAGISDPGSKGLDFLRLKGFENAVIVAATRALDEWKQEAHKGGWSAAAGHRWKFGCNLCRASVRFG